MIPPGIQAKIDDVAACGPIRAWSVIVTVLGDLCASRQDRISAQVLVALVAPLGISAQASRVAVHRLRRDGWIETDRAGRGSLYRLSEAGWNRTEAVRPRIYARARPEAAAALVVGPPELSQADLVARLGSEAVALAPRTALVSAETPVEPGVLKTSCSGAVPAWVEPLLVDPADCANYAALAAAVSKADIPAAGRDPLSGTALRLAVLHHWRRLCLRHSPLADGLMPPGWPGDRAREMVTTALDQLPRPDLDALLDAVRSSA